MSCELHGATRVLSYLTDSVACNISELCPYKGTPADGQAQTTCCCVFFESARSCVLFLGGFFLMYLYRGLRGCSYGSRGFRFIGFNKISHENISGKRAASEGAGLNVSGPAKIGLMISCETD